MLPFAVTGFILVDHKSVFGVATFDRAAVKNTAVFGRSHGIRQLHYAYCIRVMSGACIVVLLSTGTGPGNTCRSCNTDESRQILYEA